ncbi:MAG: aminoglycoside phosphotransferase family protein [Chloroflexota bacterium]
MNTQVEPLLGYLSEKALAGNLLTEFVEWQGWQIEPIIGGYNNLLYHARSKEHDWAIKFTRRDARDRAGREYTALKMLQALNLHLAPQAVYLNRDDYIYPVVVQTWLDGKVQQTPPQTDEEWRELLRCMVALHKITPDSANSSTIHGVGHIPPATLSMYCAANGLARIRQQVAQIPVTSYPDEVATIVNRIQRDPFPDWPRPISSFCHVDPNTLNFVRTPQTWLVVDWENSGWGDPAFEIADLMSHPAYMDVPEDRWPWVVEQYCQMSRTPEASERIWVYYRLMIVWWVVRFLRYVIESEHHQQPVTDPALAQQFSQRLALRPVDDVAVMRRKYDYYCTLAITQTGKTMLQ